MAVYYDKGAADERLTLYMDELAEKRRFAAVNVVQECMGILAKTAKEIPDQQIPSPQADAAPFVIRKAPRLCSVEPFFEGGQIGRDVYRCGKCEEKVGKHDKYCLNCGRELV